MTLVYGKAKCPKCGEINNYTEIVSLCSFMLNSPFLPPPNKCCKCDTDLSSNNVIERYPDEIIGSLVKKYKEE